MYVKLFKAMKNSRKIYIYKIIMNSVLFNPQELFSPQCLAFVGEIDKNISKLKHVSYFINSL